MFGVKLKGKKGRVNWQKLDSGEALNQVMRESETQNVLIFKHSSRCSLSAMIKGRLEHHWSEDDLTDVKPYFLDLITFREISNAVARQFDVPHQSPQVLVIKNGSCIYDNSHYGISYYELKNVFSKADMV